MTNLLRNNCIAFHLHQTIRAIFIKTKRFPDTSLLRSTLNCSFSWTSSPHTFLTYSLYVFTLTYNCAGPSPSEVPEGYTLD